MSPPHRQRVAQHYAAMQFKSTDSVTSDGGSLKRVRCRRDGSCKICRIRSVVYEVNRRRNPRRWSRSTRCWHQPGVVWINQPPDELDQAQKLTLTQAA